MADCCCTNAGQACCPAQESVPALGSAWGPIDWLGAARVRLGFARMSYGVAPGLYRMGTPTADDPVLVTANYKLSVDVLRRELAGRNLWILVLDTANVNVWCAAGKGTFGTAELVRRVAATGLAGRVSHRRLILPQLGAPGVAAHEVQQQAGFRVVYGPVRAADLPAFLDGGLTATPDMRRVRFPLVDRLVLTPIELRQHLGASALLAAVLAIVPGLWRGWEHGWQGPLAALAGWLAGCMLGPALLPWLPGRAFWVKGAWLGAALGGLLAALDVPRGLLPALGGVLWLGAGVSHLLMHFTGCTTFTSPSGVKRELKVVPYQIATGALGLGLWSTSWWL